MLNWKKQDCHRLNRLSKPLLLFLLLLAAVACGPADATPTPATINNTPLPSDSGYPPPQPTAYIPSASDAYPVVETNPGIALMLDKPIAVGATTVSGVGPPGLTVYLMNITLMGEQLGTAVINNEGRFSMQVGPIQPGIRIGLTADVTTVGLTEEDIAPGEGAIQIPQVGYFYDSFVTSQN